MRVRAISSRFHHPADAYKELLITNRVVLIFRCNFQSTGELEMENAANVPDLTTDDAKVAEMRRGANWFFWIAILAAVPMFLIYFGKVLLSPSMIYSGVLANRLVGLGTGLYVDALFAASGGEGPQVTALAVNLVLVGLLVLFGYLARRGNDFAFILGMFLYFFDAVVLLGYREFFAFGFHIFCLFFLFKGLLASRRRYDPSVDATGA